MQILFARVQKPPPYWPHRLSCGVYPAAAVIAHSKIIRERCLLDSTQDDDGALGIAPYKGVAICHRNISAQNGECLGKAVGIMANGNGDILGCQYQYPILKR